MADSSRTQYVTLAEAAELMSVSVKTLRRRIADGTIPAYRCGRRVIRIRVADLQRAFCPIPSARR
jgi:excisionase family DNA binding protein